MNDQKPKLMGLRKFIIAVCCLMGFIALSFFALSKEPASASANITAIGIGIAAILGVFGFANVGEHKNGK